MQSVQQQLEEYRRTRKSQQDGGEGVAASKKTTEAVQSSSDTNSLPSRSSQPGILTKFFEQLADSRLSRSYFAFRTARPWLCRFMVFAFWLCCQLLFASFEFGCVFFAASVLVMIYASLRSEPKKKGEVSAYSVFNPNCERLMGQMTAEHFESELLRRNVPRRS